jgi:hypothetical protein
MRIKSALVLTAFSAFAAWATCANAGVFIRNVEPHQGGCYLNGILQPVGDVEKLPETVVDSNGNTTVIYHNITCTAAGWKE